MSASGPAAAAAAAEIEAVGVGWVLEEHVRLRGTSEMPDGLAAADSLLDVVQWGWHQVGENYAYGDAVHAGDAAGHAAVAAVRVAAAAVQAVADAVRAVAAAVHAGTSVAVAEPAFEFESCD